MKSYANSSKAYTDPSYANDSKFCANPSKVCANPWKTCVCNGGGSPSTGVDSLGPPVALCVERFGGLDVMVANAGVLGELARTGDYPGAPTPSQSRSPSRSPPRVATPELCVSR